jgi:oxidase EvaA
VEAGAQQTLAWLAQRRVAAALKCEPIDWNSCHSWRFEHGRLSHESCGYFTIVAVSVRSSVLELDGLVSLMIDQPEIGVLGFIACECEHGTVWLVQAKAEPGNVGEVQIAPSVQATFSNYTRRHEGAATRYIERMLPEGAVTDCVTDTRQSEHGTLFFRKHNRNVTIVCPLPGEIELDDDWQWASSRTLRALLARDFVVNTDARSVIATTPWRLISDKGYPFLSESGSLQEKLAASYAVKDEADALGRLEALRRATMMASTVLPIDAFPSIARTAHEIVAQVGFSIIRIRPYSVASNRREIAAWRHPLVSRDGHARAVFVVAEREGLMCVFLRFSVEPGFDNIVQLGPSYQSDALLCPPAWLVEAIADPRTKTLVRINQSEEGGRFYKVTATYQILEIPGDTAEDDDRSGVWVTLGALECLALRRSVVTNEARSLISLLLIFA